MDQFKSDGQSFLQSLLNQMEDLGLAVQNLRSDHLCFRVETEDQYAEYKAFLLSEARLLTEAQVNGRSIATFALKEPFVVEDQKVYLVELPSPKAGANYKLGFEHAEFVIQESLTLFAKRFPNLDFKFSGNKNTNSELCLKMPIGQVKFHNLSLERIIEIENAPLQDIIFDFDGTLIQSRETLYEINRLVFSEILEREVSLKESQAKFHSEFSKLFVSFKVESPLKKDKAISMWGDVSERFEYQLFDGAQSLLDSLRELDYGLHLWTARDEKSARRILEHHGLTDYFQTLSFANSSESKPHAKSLNFDWARAAKDSVLVIGDSPADILGSKNIKAISAAALWDPHGQEAPLIQEGAELCFYGVGEFRDWVLKK